ncbi:MULTISPECIES: hypothetical protein [Halorussus]|uniref:hypothetical protein n=1 Tax=Halorussus TaxID=1070314 RepID=UPI00209C7548|nr:hypothetical protein [Halorussus vallis]USZ78739.1 hypothetical protein NGM07_24825 [Halorussus vallis]
MTDSLTAETSVEQVLTGLQVGRLGPSAACCTTCGRDLHDGHPVTVYATKPADSDRWALPRVYCRREDCDREEIRSPTLGVTEVLATAFLASTQLGAAQTVRVSLSSVEIRAWSGPTEGTTL